MSYFRTNLGKRPVDQPDAEAQPKSDAGWEKERPYFAARLGPCPSKAEDRRPEGGDRGVAGDSHSSQSPHAERQAPISCCPLCRAALLAEGGLYRCAGRCGAAWLEESPGRLVDLAALPFGVCRCCRAPRALVRGERGAVCPASGSAHLLLPDGTTILADTAPQGVCQCCAPPAPLVWRDQALVCSARPDNHYRRAGEQLVLIPTTPAATETLEAIDAALRQNSARLTVHGLFDLD